MREKHTEVRFLPGSCPHGGYAGANGQLPQAAFGEGEVGHEPLWGVSVGFRRHDGALEGWMGGGLFVMKCVWVWCGPHLSVCISPLYAADVHNYVSRLLSCAGSQACQVDDTPMRGLMTPGFLWEDLSLGDKGGFRESFSLHLLLSKCL